MKILAFAASNSRQSINNELIHVAAGYLAGKGAEVDILSLINYEMPLFNVDVERELGIPGGAERFYTALSNADAVLVSVAEHNGSYSAVYKNLIDWVSRVERKFFNGRPMLLLSASPGTGGASRALQAAAILGETLGANVVGGLSIADFNNSFDFDAKQFKDKELMKRLSSKLDLLASGVPA